MKSMITKTLKAIGLIFGGLLALVLSLYLIAVGINGQDRDRSEAAIRFANLYTERPSVADEDNAFVYLMGYEAPLADNPRDAGLRRIARMQPTTGAAPPGRAGDPVQRPLERLTPPSVQEFRELCGTDRDECVTAFAAGAPVLAEWLAAEGWLLDRYGALLTHAGWREVVPADPSLPFPSFAPAFDGQLLLLLSARAVAEQGDAAAVAAMLGRDLRFWRNVLAASDTLLTKMIATAALRRHFELGNLVLRTFPPGYAAPAVPVEWSSAITDTERSMLRCITGEWQFASALLATAKPGRADGASLLDPLLAPLYQPQDTLNRHADYLWSAHERLDAPLDRYAAAADAATSLAENSEALPRSLYNVVGALLLAPGGAVDFGAYGRRVADVEGIRRAALAAVTLRDAGVTPADVAAALSASGLRNPYDGQPLLWDESHGAVVFRGLEPGGRGEHRIFY